MSTASLVEHTEEFALKDPDRYKEKLAKLIARFNLVKRRRSDINRSMMEFDTHSKYDDEIYTDGVLLRIV